MATGLIATASIRCVMCSRVAGHVLQGVFIREERTAAPVMVGSTARCGECRGNFVVEPEAPLTPAMAATVMARRADAADPQGALSG